MSRPLRIQFEGAYYHVTCRGNERRPIFRDDTDRRMFLDRLARSAGGHGVRLLCYVLMRNHYHLLIQTPKPNLSKFMMHFNGGYTMAFNRRHRRAGHLYQGRYHAVVVDRDAYLLEVSRYLHLNPVRVGGPAGLSTHRWSSYAGYVSTKRREPFVEYSELLDFFGGDTAHARRRYSGFVRDGIQGECPNPFAGIASRLMLGSEEFVERISAGFLSDAEDARERPSLRAITQAQAPERVLRVISETLRIGTDRLTAKGRRTIERGLAMETVYRHCGLTQPKIGELFGGVDYSTVSVERKRFLHRISKDERLRRTFDKIDRELQNVQ